jgi:RIO-like serine/threonine protein kinase
MNLLDQAAKFTDQADLVILSHVETIRDQQQPATASAVASLIGGAPRNEISKRLARLARLGLIDASLVGDCSWQLSTMGAEFLQRELIGWSPSNRENRRRDSELYAAVINPSRR